MSLPSNYRIVSIDPGATHLGIAISHCVDNRLKVLHAESLEVDKMVRMVYGEGFPYGKRAAQMAVIKDFIASMLHSWQPSVVASEVPYLDSQNIDAYTALYDCVQTIKHVLIEGFKGVPLVTINPSVAKADIGIPKDRYSDKDAVSEHILSSDLLDLSDIFADQLDQHAFDAILMGNSHYKTMSNWRKFHET